MGGWGLTGRDDQGTSQSNNNVLSYMDVDLCQNSLNWTLRVKHFTVCKFNTIALNWNTGERRRVTCMKEGAICTGLEEWLQPLRWGRKCWRGVGIRFNQGSDTSQKMGWKILSGEKQWKYTYHPHVVFSENSSSEIIALHNNWGMQYGSWYK